MKVHGRVRRTPIQQAVLQLAGLVIASLKLVSAASACCAACLMTACWPTGTDVTFGPDGQAYRFTAKDRHADYAATRFETSSVTKLLTGKFVYTNRGLSVDRESHANAGATAMRGSSSASLIDVYAVGFPERLPTCTVRHAWLSPSLTRPKSLSCDPHAQVPFVPRTMRSE